LPTVAVERSEIMVTGTAVHAPHNYVHHSNLDGLGQRSLLPLFLRDRAATVGNRLPPVGGLVR